MEASEHERVQFEPDAIWPQTISKMLTTSLHWNLQDLFRLVSYLWIYWSKVPSDEGMFIGCKSCTKMFELWNSNDGKLKRNWHQRQIQLSL